MYVNIPENRTAESSLKGYVSAVTLEKMFNGLILDTETERINLKVI